MIYNDSHDSLLAPAWTEKPDADYKAPTIQEYKASDEIDPSFDPLSFLFGTSPQAFDSDLPMDLGYDVNELEIGGFDLGGWGASPEKQCGLSLLDKYLHANTNVFLNAPDSNLDNNYLHAEKPVFLNLSDAALDNKENKPSQLSPDSGIEQDGIINSSSDNTSYDECSNIFGLMEKDVDGLCESVKLNNDSELNKYLSDVLNFENNDIDDEITEQDLINFAGISDSKWNEYVTKTNVRDAVGTQDTKNFVYKWKFPTLPTSNPVVKNEFRPYRFNIKEEICDANLFVLRNNSTTIIIEHNYSKRICVIESDEDDYEPVKKRKRNEVDEDFSPYQKPKRKVGRPRTNFSKINNQKTQPLKQQKTRAPKKTTQAAKKLKSVSTVPYERRQQHNQAERERRDMLKKNLDIVEDMTPDHFLHLTQVALQSEKISKLDDFDNNENNFTVDVLKKLDELVKKEPVNHKPKFKKAARNSKMVVLLGATYYIGGLEKELKLKESRLAQLKKQYDECLKRFNPTKVSTKRVRRNY